MLRIAYLMEDTDLSGGVRIQMAQADALIDRGHAVTIVTKGMPTTWRRTRAEWRHVDTFSQIHRDEFDFLIGTFWTTVRPAFEIAGDRTIHLCQGYEGAFAPYQPIKPEIDAVYRLPIPKIVVSPHLVPIVKTFTDDVSYVGQIVDDEFFRSRFPEENEPLRVLLSGPFEIDLKGIAIGYAAAVHARWYGARFHLIRVSPWAPSGGEPVSEHVHEFHVALDAAEMTRLMHTCDLLIAPNMKEEGFGLPAAEAMASGIPTVLTRIPSFLAFGDPHDYALFADEDDAIDLGERLLEAISDPDLRERLRRRGREVAEQFRSARTGERLERFLREREERLLAKAKS